MVSKIDYVPAHIKAKTNVLKLIRQLTLNLLQIFMYQIQELEPCSKVKKMPLK